MLGLSETIYVHLKRSVFKVVQKIQRHSTYGLDVKEHSETQHKALEAYTLEWHYVLPNTPDVTVY